MPQCKEGICIKGVCLSVTQEEGTCLSTPEFRQKGKGHGRVCKDKPKHHRPEEIGHVCSSICV